MGEGDRVSGGRGLTLWCLHGHALVGLRVQKVQRVQRFDTAFGREGCGGRLRRQNECRLAAAPPFGACMDTPWLA